MAARGKPPQRGLTVTINGSWHIPPPGRMFWTTVTISVTTAAAALLHKILVL